MPVIKTNIKKCDKQCPFYECERGYVECTHPYWLDKDICETLISSFSYHFIHIKENNGIPKACPLQHGKIVQIIQLK